jgi:peptidyl-prolyl cis-trans isomerase A (cyclophilin A)
MSITKRLAIATILLTAWPAVAGAQAKDNRQPGLYWTLETDLGNISCKLFEKEAPNTVRTMVGLAIGKISYLDPTTGATMKKKYFDGLVFHRVIPNFMIQGGDPTGTGSGSPGGPGFPYKNENVPSLNFDVAGRLAMANRGKDTNGSQFFITEGPVSLPPNTYTIWGQCENLNVVKAIARVPVTGDHPNNPPHIKRVIIERVGPAPANAPESMP